MAEERIVMYDGLPLVLYDGYDSPSFSGAPSPRRKKMARRRRRGSNLFGKCARKAKKFVGRRYRAAFKRCVKSGGKRVGPSRRRHRR